MSTRKTTGGGTVQWKHLCFQQRGLRNPTSKLSGLRGSLAGLRTFRIRGCANRTFPKTPSAWTLKPSKPCAERMCLTTHDQRRHTFHRQPQRLRRHIRHRHPYLRPANKLHSAPHIYTAPHALYSAASSTYSLKAERTEPRYEIVQAPKAHIHQRSCIRLEVQGIHHSWMHFRCCYIYCLSSNPIRKRKQPQSGRSIYKLDHSRECDPRRSRCGDAR